MTKSDLAALIRKRLEFLPVRTSGGESNRQLAEWLEPVLRRDRGALVDLLRDWLSFRCKILSPNRTDDELRDEGYLWLAITVIGMHKIPELSQDIEHLITDIRSGKAFMPYYEGMILRVINE
jgi:hypothetical protein